MKAFSSKLCMCVIFVLCVPILLISLFGYLLFVPFDIIRYHRMPYFKDFGDKYQFFITSRDVVRIYNRIVREQLPVEYVKSNDFEYFVKDGIVLLCGWDHDGFKQVDGEWFLALDDECNTKITVKEALENETDLLKPEHKCLPVKFLIFYSDVTDAEKFEQVKKCPYFYCVFSEEDLC